MMASPASTRSGPSIRSRSTAPTAKPARSRSSGAMTPGCSAVSPPISTQPAGAAPVSDALHHGGDPLRIDLAGGDVVEHEERLGPETDQIVDAHGHQVDAHGAVAAGGLGHRELGPHPVGRRDQHRVGETGRVERELRPEAADPRHQALHLLHRQVAGTDVDARSGVGGSRCRRGPGPSGAAPDHAVRLREAQLDTPTASPAW